MVVCSQAAGDCVPLGLAYLPPQNLCTEEIIHSSTAALAKALDRGLDAFNSTPNTFKSNIFSFSVSLFSVHESENVYKCHHTASRLDKSRQGTRNVNVDTAYRIGSSTQLLIVLFLVLHAGKVSFDDLATVFSLELGAIAEIENIGTMPNDVDDVQWNDINVGALASHQADTEKDCKSLFVWLIRDPVLIDNVSKRSAFPIFPLQTFPGRSMAS